MTTAYDEPDLIVLSRHGNSWQGTARNGGFFVVGEFADDRDGAMTSCVEKYHAEITDKVKAWRENVEQKPAAKGKPKVVPAPLPYDPLEDI